MSAEFVADGGPVALSAASERHIGVGPWARALALAVVGDERSAEAVRGAELARGAAARALRIELGAVFAEVDDDGESCEVSLLVARVPVGIWSAMTRFARTRASLQPGVEGSVQSTQLEQLMTEDWGEPLVPGAEAIARACTCTADGDCEHVAAVGYVLADAVDGDPARLLRWRGCVDGTADGAGGGDPWRGGLLPELAPRRPRPADAVLLRLGPSGIRVGDGDLTDVLRRAYDAFASGDSPGP